jgi:hypothetical protein
LAIFELFSKRQKKHRGEVPDVYTYDEIPEPLRVQIVHIWVESLGRETYENSVEKAWEFIVETLCREYGVFRLLGAKDYGNRDYVQELSNFVLNEPDTEKVLDSIELSFRVIDKFTRNWEYRRRQNASKEADAAITELNGRFKEHGIGYQYVEGEIIKVDSQLIHSEVVKPALTLLHTKSYLGAQEEYLAAYEHYRHGNYKEALNECLKSFESTMKSVCDKRGWEYDKNATSKPLIKICMDNGLIPEFWQNHYSSLRSLLESSIPTGRNKLGGHGQGSSPTEVPEYLVAYMLHMTASAIVFLVEAEKNFA